MKKAARNSPAEDYLKAAIAFQEAADQSDHRASNRAHTAISRAARKIRSSEDRGREFLSSLLDHTMPHVCLWAAFHLLPIDEFSAVRTLKRISKGPASDAKVSAEITLTEWQSGNLDVDWFMEK